MRFGFKKYPKYVCSDFPFVPGLKWAEIGLRGAEKISKKKGTKRMFVHHHPDGEYDRTIKLNSMRLNKYWKGWNQHLGPRSVV